MRDRGPSAGRDPAGACGRASWRRGPAGRQGPRAHDVRGRGTGALGRAGRGGGRAAGAGAGAVARPVLRELTAWKYSAPVSKIYFDERIAEGYDATSAEMFEPE